MRRTVACATALLRRNAFSGPAPRVCDTTQAGTTALIRRTLFAAFGTTWSAGAAISTVRFTAKGCIQGLHSLGLQFGEFTILEKALG